MAGNPPGMLVAEEAAHSLDLAGTRGALPDGTEAFLRVPGRHSAPRRGCRVALWQDQDSEFPSPPTAPHLWRGHSGTRPAGAQVLALS